MAVTTPAEMAFATRLVAMQDEAGMPLDLSLEMAQEQGLRVPLLGLLHAAAERSWGAAAVRQMCAQWRRLNTPNVTELVALDSMGVAG